MTNILWITNKYVDGESRSHFYPDFLKNVEEKMETSGSKMNFIFFSNAMRDKVKSKNNFFYPDQKISLKNLSKEAKRIERDYGFTFKQACFPDLIQVSKSQDMRKISLPEREFSRLDYLVPRFTYLEEIIKQAKIDIVFCDQSPEAEMEFARSICLKLSKIFLRYDESFLGHCLYYQQFGFGKERIAEAVLDKKMTLEKARYFVNDFVQHERLPYQRREMYSEDKTYIGKKMMHFYRYPNYIKMALMKPYLYFEEKILKKLIEDKFNPEVPFLFFGFHLPTESTVGLRALPFMNQISLIESISRVLPYGTFLYVREHPHARRDFPYGYLKRIKAMPNVRLLSAEIPISEILKKSLGVLTYNATTGIEALMYGKPVLSFAPNVYYGYHPSADFCSDLYKLAEQLVSLVNREVKKEDTYDYVKKLFSISSSLSLNASTFLSEEDAEGKAGKFTAEINRVIMYCKEKEKK